MNDLEQFIALTGISEEFCMDLLHSRGRVSSECSRANDVCITDAQAAVVALTGRDLAAFRKWFSNGTESIFKKKLAPKQDRD